MTRSFLNIFVKYCVSDDSAKRFLYVIEISNKTSKAFNNYIVYACCRDHAFKRKSRKPPCALEVCYIRNDITNLGECKLTPVCF